MTKRLLITETALRDAHQSLFATRMGIEDMLPILPKLDEIGYFSLEMWGGATFDSCVRFLGEDPWERVTKIKEKTPNTKLQMLLRGQNLLGYKHYSDDIVDIFVKLAAQRGIDIFRIFDALNDLRNIEASVKAVKKYGKTAEGAISFTTSPIHTIEKYVENAKQMENMGCDILCIKDMAGLLTPKEAYDLISEIKRNVSLPVHLHCHYTSGMATSTYLKAAEAGVDIVDCAISSLGFRTSQPGTESVVASLREFPFETGLDLKKLQFISEYFKKIAETSLAPYGTKATDVNVDVLINQVPGGMISNLANQLKEQGKMDLLPEVLKEIATIRKELGYPPLVTPSSQIVGTQATFNVLMGERYKTILQETKNYLKGMYGMPPGIVDSNLLKKALGDEKPVTCRPADLLEPSYEKVKAEISDISTNEEDIMTYAMFPEVGRKFLEAKKNGTLNKIKEQNAKKTSKSNSETHSDTMKVKVNGNIYEVEVER